MQALRLGWSDERIMRNGQQIFSHKPHWLLRSHPLERIEAAHVHGPGKSPQRSLSAQIEVCVEITERQLAERTIDRFAITAAGVIRFSQSTPVPVDAINGNHVIGV